MWLQLAQKTVIVTGAGSGIGASVAKALVSEGCHVVLVDRSASAMDMVLEEWRKSRHHSNGDDTTSSCLSIACDVSQSDQVNDMMRQADVQMPTTPTMLVNCAGIAKDGWIGKMSVENWQGVLDVNLTGTFLCCRAFLDQARLQNVQQQQVDSSLQHSIVNLASVVGRYGSLGQANYAASKAGVVGLTKALAKETADRGVRVNAILPGFIDTPMTQAVPQHIKEQMISNIAMRRFGEPEEVANLASFLLSPRSSYITGESFEISGMIAL